MVGGQPPSAVVPVPFQLGPWWTPLYGTSFFFGLRGRPGLGPCSESSSIVFSWMRFRPVCRQMKTEATGLTDLMDHWAQSPSGATFLSFRRQNCDAEGTAHGYHQPPLLVVVHVSEWPRDTPGRHILAVVRFWTRTRIRRIVRFWGTGRCGPESDVHQKTVSPCSPFEHCMHRASLFLAVSEHLPGTP